MKIQTWTIRNRAGELIASGVADVTQWLKVNTSVLVVATMPSIKELVIY